MIIKKSIADDTLPTLTGEDLALINRYSMTELTADDVFVFAIRLCDNALDRDFECFTVESLNKLAELFVGKPGIFDHAWSAQGQVARVFKTEVVCDAAAGKAALRNEVYTYLKGYAYILRTPDTENVIAQIKGGILKEVSVGCAIGKSTCCICGENAFECMHIRGKYYDDNLCFFVLEDPIDAYEWSFVAVPAQPNAGVTKSLETGSGPDSPPADTVSAKYTDDDLVIIEKLRYGGIF